MEEHEHGTPRPITREETHNLAMALFEQFPRGVVLDAQCGQGALALRLINAGFTVRCCDIDLGLMKLEGVENKAVDLNVGRVDYPSESFDYIASTNGLHRLYSIENAIKEFHRLLKPGGKAVIGFPNYSSIPRRIRFLLTGSLARNIARQEYQQTIDRPEAHVRIPLTLAQLRTSLMRNGFVVKRVAVTPVRPASFLLWPLALAIKVVAFGWPTVRRHRSALGLDMVNSFAVLAGGRHVFVVAAKEG